MLEYIRKKLEELGCDAYEITETRTTGWEFYFIRHKLDQNRAKDLTEFRVSVYKSIEDGKFLGKATGDIHATASHAEVDKLLKDLLFQASLVKNPYYTLNDKPLPEKEKLASVDVRRIAEDFITTMNGISETQDQDLNSYEIFVDSIETRFVNSNGVEYHCSYPKSMLEYVVNARKDGHEIELYRIGKHGACDKESIRAEVEKTLAFGKDRLRAVNTPVLESLPVLLSTDVATEVYSYLVGRCDVSEKYMQVSDWEIGKPISDALHGDKPSIEVLRYLPNSSGNFDVDEEGAYIKERFLVQDGIMKGVCGRRQFSQYVGVEDNSIAYNVRVTGGSKSAEELRSGDYIEIVEFSDFQVDEMGGDIAGEIRLGYLHRGGETLIVTGGSVAGNMEDAIKEMTFSKELIQYDRALIPAVTCLKGLRITGVE
jgi:PmbA protein